MKSFEYMVAGSLEAAVAQYGEGGSTLKAGGFDLIDRMKERLELPESVLSIGSIKDLAYIKEEKGAIHIGALTTLADMGRSELLAKKARALQETAGAAATPQVRERATLGGNLLQRPRCWYFRNAEFACLKKGGPQCFAPHGENQFHAILGGGPCHIVHPSNCAVALVALGAEIVMVGKRGERTVKAEDLFVLPSESLMKEALIGNDEILKEIVIPNPPSQSATVELREKQSFDWPMVMASAARVDGKWRVCLGAVAPKPWLCEAAAKVLGARRATRERAAEAGEVAAQKAQPLSENGYKVQLAKVAVKRAVMAAAGLEA